MSKHWLCCRTQREPKELTQTKENHPLTSSLLCLPLGSWWNSCCSLYAGSPIPSLSDGHVWEQHDWTDWCPTNRISVLNAWYKYCVICKLDKTDMQIQHCKAINIKPNTIRILQTYGILHAKWSKLKPEDWMVLYIRFSFLGCSDMAHNFIAQFYLPPSHLIYKWNEPYLPLLPSHRA